MTLRRFKQDFEDEIQVKIVIVYALNTVVISDRLYNLLSSHEFNYSGAWGNIDIISISEYAEKYNNDRFVISESLMTLYVSKKLLAKIKLISK